MNVEYTQIRKADRVTGKTLVFRNATERDARFILTLRTDAQKARFLSETRNDLPAQERWLADYSDDDSQAYFVIEYRHEAIGTVRLYDAHENSFCWGSWILSDAAPTHAAIESALMVYAYACDHLGFEKAHFDVRKNNCSVWKFHERFGAIRTRESEADFFYEIPAPMIAASRKRYARFLPGGVTVDQSVS